MDRHCTDFRLWRFPLTKAETATNGAIGPPEAQRNAGSSEVTRVAITHEAVGVDAEARVVTRRPQNEW
eukprot:COSAG02_NODE_2260_length_9317_cov_10.918365_4_plen_68_part_00